MEIKGKFNTAIVFAEIVDDFAIGQITELCCQEAFAGAKIRIMPDVHAGAGCTIGTTMTVTDRLVPNLVGVDIGCGMLAANVTGDMDWEKLDSVIRAKVPCGFYVHDNGQKLPELDRLRCHDHVDINRAQKSIGTLGGGNHFIEVDRASGGTLYLVIHTGSRNLGKQVAEYYQHLAVELNQGREEYFKKRNALIAEYKAAGRRKEIQAALKELHWADKPLSVPEDLCFLYGEHLDNYLHDVEICQQFARRNRELIAQILLERAGLTGADGFHTIHNYIDTDEMILRKGAIAAHKGEKVLIPINMRDGSVLAIGRGNPEWNYSAPHGAGRLMSRGAARETLSMEAYTEAMKGIYTTSVNLSTIDEAPMAYKALEDIIDVIRDSVDVVDIMKPIYNFKASD